MSTGKGTLSLEYWWIRSQQSPIHGKGYLQYVWQRCETKNAFCHRIRFPEMESIHMPWGKHIHTKRRLERKKEWRGMYRYREGYGRASDLHHRGGMWGALRVDSGGSNSVQAVSARGMFITEQCLSFSNSEQWITRKGSKHRLELGCRRKPHHITRFLGLDRVD